jgi:hypothetical protein
METKPDHRPGDHILDRYVPHLSSTDRELARERLQTLASWLVHVAMDQVRDDMRREDSRGRQAEATMESVPPRLP